MFSFLNSTVLLAAAAALIPLIIHLFSRRRVKVIEFSSLRHLKEMQKRQLRRLKIRQLLLLLLRMLIILLAVLAFARPTSREGDMGSHAAVSAVVLFDNSASMNRYVVDGNLFDIAKRRTADLLQTFSQSDEVCLLALDRSTGSESAEFGTAAVALEQVQRLAAGGAQAGIQAGLTTAVELLSRAHNLNREVYLVTDRQRTSLPETAVLEGQAVEVYLVDLPLEENDNLGVVSLDLGGQLLQAGHDFEVVATVRNYGERDSDQQIASLFLDGQRVAQTEFAASGGGETVVRFSRAVSSTGFHSGFVEISDDNFPTDNRRYFSFRIPDQFTLLLIDGDPVSEYLSLALVPPTSGGQYWSVKRTTPAELTGVNFREYDVVVLAGVPALTEVQADRLRAYVADGKALFLIYGGRTDIAYFNAVWAEVSGVTYDQGIRQNFSRAGYYTLKSVAMEHPVFSVFNFDEAPLPEIRFYTLPQVRVSGDAVQLATFSGDSPALVERAYEDGKVITFVGPMSPEYTDLPGHGFFVPLVARIGEYLAADLSALEVELHTGENITRSLALAGAVDMAVEMVLPDSSLQSLPPEEDKGLLVVHTGPQSEAGEYRLSMRGREIDRFALNVRTEECDLAAAEVDQFGLALGAAEARQLGTEDNLAEALTAFRVGREWWQVILWAVLVLLAVEMLLGRRAATED